MRTAALALACLLLPAAGEAQTRPQLMPAQDMMVQYTLSPASGGAPTSTETWYYSAATGIIRIENSRAATHTLMGTRDNSMRAVDHANRQVVKIDRLTPGGLFDPSSVFTRLGESRAAGQDCTDWRVAPPAGSAAPPGSPPAAPTLCVNAQGVALRRTFGTEVALATTVTRLDPAQQPADRFTVPPGYRAVTGTMGR